ncbi:MAG TPA: MDR family MFS transporter, partial [Deinococcales bacterium]|nr:MDR family MFS transporter [Deinococcales bacterium]
TAGPAIQKDLAIEPSLYPWLTTAFLVASTVMVPIYGKLSDLYGRRRILLTGITIFLAASALCGLAANAGQLIAFRALQGAGSAALFTTAFAIIADIFPPSERGKYAGLFGAVFGLSSVVGPLVGGFITDTLGWHWVFFVNLPIGAVAVAFILSKMPPLKRAFVGKRPSVDIPGALLLAVGTVPLLLALSLGKSELYPGETGFLWGSPQILGMFALSLLGFVAFVLRERVAPDPILDLGLFRNRIFAVGMASTFVLGAGFLAAIVFLPLFMVNVVGLSATNSGLTTTPLTFGVVAGNIISGQIVSRTGRYKPLMLIGLAVLAAGFIIMGFTVTPNSTQGELTLKMILVGLGLGPTIPLYTLAVQNAVSPAKIGVVTSSATFFRQMGSTIGVAIIGTVFANALSSNIAANMREAAAGLPASYRQQFMPVGGGVPSEGAGGGTFDAAAIKAGINKGIDEQMARIETAAQGGYAEFRKLKDDPTINPEVRRGLQYITGLAFLPEDGKESVIRSVRAEMERGRQQSLAAIDRVHLAFKTAFTDAIRLIYQVGIGIVLLGTFFTLMLPELPLRKTNAHGPAVAE